jgi:cysteine desulfurase
MRIPDERLRSSVRFSFGATTTEAEIDEAIRRIVKVVRHIDPTDARTPSLSFGMTVNADE